MFWCDEVAAKCSGPQTINDSKTPFGPRACGRSARRAHPRRDLPHAEREGVEARYLFGVDDYDPLDEIPAGKDEHFAQYLGQPLCNVPPPDGSPARDMAEHYMAEFWEVFAELGVRWSSTGCGTFTGRGNLTAPSTPSCSTPTWCGGFTRRYRTPIGPPRGLPFQVVCEQCGRIGTTEVYAFDGKEVSYRCRPDMVKWARGCGHAGKVSPFDGRGKLPWKLEWVAKWVTFPVTIEGAGKDHSTKGGSRDVASACLRAIFQKEPPLNVPYEFFLVGGAKMSSSRGVGASARDMADLLPARGAALPDDPHEAELAGQLRRE